MKLTGLKYEDGTIYFMGKEVSSYAAENNAVDYRTLASTFDAVSAGNIRECTDWEDWEQVSGFCDDTDSEDYQDPEVFQEFIVSSQGAEILQDAGEIVYYSERLDLYIWGVAHWGTAWDHVLTDIPVEDINEYYKSIGA